MCCAFGEPILCVFFFISKVLTETLDAKMVDVLAEAESEEGRSRIKDAEDEVRKARQKVMECDLKIKSLQDENAKLKEKGAGNILLLLSHI
jgi:hypothetical protein